MRLTVAISLLSAALATSAAAQTEAEAAAMNMQLALDLCLRNYRTEAEIVPAMQAAGFEVRPSMDAGTHEVSAPGISGLVTGDPDAGYCTIQSPQVPLPMAEAIGRAVADRLFPGKVETGGPETPVGTPPAPCEGLSVFAPQQLIRITYAAAGNSGECREDGSSAIIVTM